MRYLILFIVITFSTAWIPPGNPSENISPLKSFSTVWQDPKYDIAYSAKNASYMNEMEREVIVILNLVRIDPVMFEKTVLSQYPASLGKPEMKNSSYFKSLSSTLKNLK